MSLEKHSFVKKMVDHILSEDSLVKSLRDAESLGKLLWENNIGIYSLARLERDLSSKYPSEIISKIFEINNQPNKEELFIISEPYLTGGHTRLMERLSSFIEYTPDLVISRKSSDTSLDRMKLFFNEVFLYTEENIKNDIDRIFEIAKKIYCYQKIILNIHPDDIHVVIACSIVKKIRKDIKIFFVNHADHLFSYGVSVSDVWFEISSFGKRIDALRELSSCKSFLGIPLDSRLLNDDFIYSSDTIKDGDVFFTSGSSYKFNGTNGISFKSIISYVMSTYPNSEIHVVGCDIIKNHWWVIEKLKFKNRLKLISKIPYDEYLSITNKSTVYIDSHPIPGGTAFIEQFFSNKKCVGLTSPIQGYSPIELLKSKDLADSFNPVNLHEKINKIVPMIKDVHSLESVKRRFIDAVYNDIYTENLCEHYMDWSGDVHFLEKDRIMKIPSSIKGFSYIRALALINIGAKATIINFMMKVERKFVNFFLKRIIKNHIYTRYH
ncbi:hypothetical protein BV924_14835 [Pectobacterium odoriferum]|uniref:Glycosyltransferase n=1 Tax=Pectobacterium odoriferum TaxID=78398 RepID=A0ABD6VPE9_9GAMM|nr:hypothetical protein [Pectobacterium odoriferum]POD95601.1 hypothetical protein BVY06_13395 [Pectobacterium odoriferum]POE11488.1 hypothetical protein BV924_14835 [Pectobacterium odoriferum]POE25638.1 hypothetical protein BV926_14840 [Pectobacterium odoriferum]POE30027.1 hypothetical protein BV919_14860 [Pectobacterium odoriferum]POE38898.1 hypothetical protein BV920_14810 [Pectobacterium odoriferum]